MTDVDVKLQVSPCVTELGVDVTVGASKAVLTVTEAAVDMGDVALALSVTVTVIEWLPVDRAE